MPMRSPRISTAEPPATRLPPAGPERPRSLAGWGARATWALASAMVLGAPPRAAADEPVPLRVQVSDPRAYGYQVGDTALRRVTIDVPRRLRLDEASLPEVLHAAEGFAALGDDAVVEQALAIAAPLAAGADPATRARLASLGRGAISWEGAP